MSQYQKFLKYFAGFVLIYFTATFLTNLLVDPYGVWKNGGRMQNSRVIKAIKLHQNNPKTLILGTSGVATGLNPNDPSFLHEQPVYNLGLFGADIYEIKHYFYHSAKNNDLKKVILGLDFYAFNEFMEVAPDFSQRRLGAKYRMLHDVPALYLSLDSLNLVLNQEQRGKYFADQGEYIREEEKDQITYIFEREFVEDLSEKGMYIPYHLSSKKLDYFREITQIADNNNIEAKVFLPPIHATMFYTLMISNYWSDYEKWLKEIVKTQPVWDFSGCNSITTEAINAQMENYFDATHYTFKVGNLIMKQISNHGNIKTTSDFGVYVTSDNVETHLANIKRQCKTWQQNNPKVMKWVENLKKQIRKTQI